MNNADMPAMPIFDKGGNPKNANIGRNEFECGGLTKRETFAAMAMQGILSNRLNINDMHHGAWVARTALAHADKLLKELAK